VSDRLANPPSTARQTEAISAPFLIDQTPPVVSLSQPRRTGNATEVDVVARDAASALLRCEYSLDAGRWIPVAPDDSIADSPEERFRVRLEGLAPGEHLVVVRAFDAAGNAGLARSLIQ
jgi:hypothetical protein